MTRLPANLPDLIRAAGVDLEVADDWLQTGRPASTGAFRPVGVLWHHTGSYDGAGDEADDRRYAQWLFKTGRSDLPAPLCHLGLSYEGKAYLGAAGRANHAGKAKASGSVAAGDGNELYVGVEMMNSGSQGFGPVQYGAAVKLGVVLMDVLGTSEQAQRGHRETSVTGKWDPGMFDLDDFREDLRRAHAAKHAQPVDPSYPRAERLLVEADQFVRRFAQASKGSKELQGLLAAYPHLAENVNRLRVDLRKLTADH